MVVYREPDTDEGAVPHRVKDAFCRSVAADFRDKQVIILESVAPPADIGASANVITFTGTDHDRNGVIPRTA